MNRNSFTHLDERGQARMVEVSDKAVTLRRAVAECTVRMRPETLELVGRQELAKGDALAVARIAGIEGAKRTSQLIPLCHPIAITGVAIDLEPADEGIRVTAEVAAVDHTGVEMEALTAAAAAALSLIDMVKGVEREVEVVNLRLLSKTGGRSGTWRRGGS